MTKKKSNVNWYFIIAGVLILYFGLFNGEEPQDNLELRRVTVQLSKDIINVKGRKNTIDYKFWTKEYENQFNILDGSITRGKHENIAKLQGGQVVDLLITESDYYELGKSNRDITIIGLRLNGDYLLSEVEFYTNRSLYKKRLSIFTAFIGAMLVLNGLIAVPKKLNYVITVVFVGVFLIMRFFEMGLY